MRNRASGQEPVLKPGTVLPTQLRYLAVSVALCAIYYAAASLGLQYASIGQSISLVWPPSGIAIAALTLLGLRYWPSIAVGAFLANASTPVPLGAAAVIAAGNTLEALVAVYLLRRSAGRRPRLDDIAQVRTLVLSAAPLGTLCGAVVGAMTLWWFGILTVHAIPRALAIWWTGDLLGALVLAPLVFAWAAPTDTRQNTRRLAEVLLLCLGTALAVEMGLGGLIEVSLLSELEYPYLLFPFVVWAALRFGPRGATLMTFTLAVVAVGHTVGGSGPFVAPTTTRTLFALACYVAAVAITGLVLAAAVHWERVQATRALAQSEERLRRALDAARMGIWFWSVETGTLTWDDNLRRLYGLASGDRIERYEDFLARVHADDRELVANSVRNVLDGDGDLDYEFRIVLPDGRVRWIADQGETRRDEQGRPISLTGICTDVTERRVAEERLRQAHRMESVGRLAGGVAHEANNQMSVVLGSASFILRRTDVPEPVRMDVEFIQQAAQRTAAVTAQLLAFSRRQILKPEVLDLNAVIQKWEPVLRRIMGEVSGVVLRLSPDLGMVRADPGQLEQVLLNLALNARDAMPRGGRISVETFDTELTAGYLQGKSGIAIQPGRYAVLAISDTGHGMDGETLSHIFEPFFTTKGIGQGTGLGLSTVYGIVKQSDGYIWAYSEPGQGTTFKIYLPVKSGVPAPARRDSAPALASTGETILVVEDEAAVRYVMTRILQDAGYKVREAAGAAEALNIIQGGEKIDLLLTDVVMPGKNGPELAASVEQLIPGVPVLFTSGYTNGEIEQRGLLKPGAAFVQKPLTPHLLVRAVRKTLGASSASSVRGGVPPTQT
jgi:PAS domain S-box-containing protein